MIEYNVGGYSVLSDKGFIPIDSVIKTDIYKKYCIYFDSGNYLECADKHILIDKNKNEIYCRDLNIGDEIYTEYGTDSIFDIIETDEYIEMYDLSLSYHHLFYANGILSHNSSTLANFAARQVLKGHDVVLFTMEMSEDAFAQRFDAIYSRLDINKIYTVNNYTTRMMSALEKAKATEKRGNLIIKQFPTGKATVNDLRMFLRELSLRGINPAIVYTDYINLMRSTGASGKDSNLYEKVKDVAEELRSLSFEFICPMVSVSQLNREGSSVSFNELDWTYTSESLGLPATVDFMSIYGFDSERAVYTSEMQYKIVKNRLGGRVGELNKFYNDNRTLKIYDSSELDLWLEDAKITEGDRSLAEVVVQEQPTGRRSSGGRRR